MKKVMLIIATAVGALMMTGCSSEKQKHDDGTTPYEPALKDVFKEKFLIGSAINQYQVAGEDTAATNLVKKHFNTVVAENVMKSEEINPQKGIYEWKLADDFVNWGNANDMFVVGHCLVWHSQLAKWFVYDDKGNYVSPDTLRQRMHDYITSVVSRYKGKVKGWDVVNEAIMDDGSYRNSPFYEILGEEYIPLAFLYANEADPDAELYINDYGMNHPGKRDKYVEIVNKLKRQGLRIDGIGMQAHMGMDYPDFDEFEESIEAFASTGSNVMITELDMSALPTITESADVSESSALNVNMNPYPDGLPTEVDSLWNQRMSTVMDILLRHSDVISRVNFWGVTDGDSWKNSWPMKGRKEYPLLFDRDYQMKPFMKEYLK
ncbi:MAG: endo-1,4-beta-xylanase [Muribaculaceae bacterium]|nr:endo-1,4-beta-xylanase [Muribaculaceae bacterium]